VLSPIIETKIINREFAVGVNELVAKLPVPYEIVETYPPICVTVSPPAVEGDTDAEGLAEALGEADRDGEREADGEVATPPPKSSKTVDDDVDAITRYPVKE
jgi:hypothetical protein